MIRDKKIHSQDCPFRYIYA